jgi:hypothetical protein
MLKMIKQKRTKKIVKKKEIITLFKEVLLNYIHLQLIIILNLDSLIKHMSMPNLHMNMYQI